MDCVVDFLVEAGFNTAVSSTILGNEGYEMDVGSVQLIMESYSYGGITAAGIRKILLSGQARMSTMVFGILYSHTGFANGGSMVRRGADAVKRAGRLIVRTEDAFGKVNAAMVCALISRGLGRIKERRSPTIWSSKAQD